MSSLYMLFVDSNVLPTTDSVFIFVIVKSQIMLSSKYQVGLFVLKDLEENYENCPQSCHFHVIN